MTRNEEGGCRPLFQGISNVLKNDIKLRPCPFCGDSVKWISCDGIVHTHKKCPCDGFPYHGERTTDEEEREGIERLWNTRSYDSALTDIEVYADNIGHVVDFLKGKCKR